MKNEYIFLILNLGLKFSLVLTLKPLRLMLTISTHPYNLLVSYYAKNIEWKNYKTGKTKGSNKCGKNKSILSLLV